MGALGQRFILIAYRVSENALPAVAPYHLKCTVYLSPSVASARAGEKLGGTGFIVAFPSRHPPHCYPYVVTNAHVVDNGNHVIRINTKDGAAEAIETIPEEWTIAPEDDLAVFEFQVPENAEWSAIIPETLLDESNQIDGWPIFPGDEVMFYSRFSVDDGNPRNKPVLRFGNIAMMADPDVLIELENRKQLAFLTECRSLSGASGSPAFVHLAQPRLMDPNDDKKGWIPSHLRLLGVVCGHLPFWTPIREKNKADAFPDVEVESNSGIAVVIPAWRLMSLLTMEHLLKERERLETELDKRTQTQGNVTMPDVPTSSNRSDE